MNAQSLGYGLHIVITPDPWFQKLIVCDHEQKTCLLMWIWLYLSTAEFEVHLKWKNIFEQNIFNFEELKNILEQNILSCIESWTEQNIKNVRTFLNIKRTFFQINLVTKMVKLDKIVVELAKSIPDLTHINTSK